jgi:hypothetical protein
MSHATRVQTTFEDARSLFKPLCAGPVPRDVYERPRWEMSGA